MSEFKHVLVAVDGSDISLKAVEIASRLAKHEGAELTALHVVPKPPFEYSGDAAAYYDEARRIAKKWMPGVQKAAALYGMGVRTEVLVDVSSVVEAIIAYAEANHIDLIVTGTRGRTPSRRMLVGSVANGLISYASCHVLVVR